MMYYRSTLTDTADGTATFATLYVWQAFSSHWREMTRTNNYRAYPRSVRARDAARRLAFKDAKRRGVHTANVGIVEE